MFCWTLLTNEFEFVAVGGSTDHKNTDRRYAYGSQVTSPTPGAVYERTSTGLTICDPKYAVNCLVITEVLPALCPAGSDPFSRNLAIYGFTVLWCGGNFSQLSVPLVCILHYKHVFHQKYSSLERQNHFHINICSHSYMLSFKETISDIAWRKKSLVTYMPQIT